MDDGDEGTISEVTGPGRPVVYCLIPADLAPKLHDLLRHHFADAGIDVVVEQRGRERRSGTERRSGDAEPPGGEERRRVRGAAGRRVGERRAPAAPAEAPPLPRRARRYAEQIAFFARVEPAGERAEDEDTARVVMRFQGGDQEAFATLYTRYFERVYSYLRVALRDQHEAEDVAQAIFMRIFEVLPDYEQRSQPFRHWLFAVTRNHALTELRKRGRVELQTEEQLNRHREQTEPPEPDLASLDWIADRDLMLFIERLPPVQRQILALRYMLGLTHREAAEVLGRSMEDVKAQHHRAVTFLRERLNAIGRGPTSGRRAKASQVFRPAEVLRHRRFALH